MTNSLRIIMIPLGLAALTLFVIALTLPLGASARAATAELQPVRLTETGDLPQARVNAVQVLPGTDVALSGAGGRLPDIAANGEFAAVVFQVGNASSSRVYIRAAQTGSGWGFTKQLDTLQGETPRLAFRNGVTNTVYVVWAGQSGQYIKFTTCTLADPVITCAAAANVNSVAALSLQLQLPAIAVDSGNNIHLAWVDRGDALSQSDNTIKTARRPNGGSSWTVTSISLTGGDSGGQPALATGGSPTEYVHLAYKDRSISGVWSVKYRRSSTASHSWVLLQEYFSGSSVQGYGRMGNPALAVTGASVYLAWDNQNSSQSGMFGLTGAQSNDSGGNWVDAPYSHHITSTQLSDTDLLADRKESYAYGTAVPDEEEGLRPSLAATGANFAIVWQQRPGGDESGNCTGEVFYAPNSSNWAAAGWGTVTADSTANYAIDPDIAIDSGTHVVFMQAPDNACNGGGVNDYTIYYRGPFDSFSTKGSRVYLPIVLKNS